MYNNGLELSVLVNGKQVKEHYSNGKAFVEARKGTQYSLKLKNTTNRRAMAIFSVDGVDVIKGKKAGDAKSGYIIEPYSKIEVKGYRIDNNSVAQFAFSDGNKSYAVQVGAEKANGKRDKTDRNNGVIGVRVVFENNYAPVSTYRVPNNVKISYNFSNSGRGISGGSPLRAKSRAGGQSVNSINYLDMDRRIDDTVQYGSSCSSFVGNDGSSGPVGCSDANASYFCQPSAPSFDTGTAWGQQVEDKISKVDFSPSNEEVVLTIYYASRNSLIDAGIDFDTGNKVSGFPDPFEKSEQYCKRPEGYRS